MKRLPVLQRTARNRRRIIDSPGDCLYDFVKILLQEEPASDIQLARVYRRLRQTFVPALHEFGRKKASAVATVTRLATPRGKRK